MRASSVIHELVSYRALLGNLVLKDLKLKYRDSVLGFLWSLLNPLMMLAVYTVVFKSIFRVQVDNFSYFLIVGILPWNFFAGSMMGSTGSIVANAGLIRKVYFPLEILPISTVLFCFAQLVLAMAVVVPAAMLALGTAPGWIGLLFVPVLALHLLFTIGLAFVLSTLTAWFRDVAHFTEVALMILFWLTPIVYAPEMAPVELRQVLKANPLALFTIAYHDVLFYGRVPELSLITSLLGWTAAALLMGHAVFRRFSHAFAEIV